MLLDLHPDLSPLAELAPQAVLGGKLLRPTFAYWAWRSVQPAGAAGEAELVRAAASLELLHASALVHDDLMDNSATRRNKPTPHLRLAEHSPSDRPDSAASFGRAGAVLLGDLLLSWSDQLFQAGIGRLPPERTTAARAQFDLMRTEVVAGQFLDVLAQARGAFDQAEALRVIELKTTRYTVQRPLLLGAVAAGADQSVLARLSGYGQAVGEAFQLRDDLLGVFGDPDETGKPTNDDLREGKRTLLLALAYAALDESGRNELHQGVGRPELTDPEADQLRALIAGTGAPELLEQRIAASAAQARDCLPEGALRADARQVLLELVDIATQRNS
ncbi:MAG TPA: polyprenyl synthetase family protein [Jatrophihabitans sp.]|nr:polyprenyl synthetase family protein [Jatrophihabitans sp.]